MDSKLEAHIDEIFQDVPKTDKMVTMINRIKSKANSKYLQIRDQGYSRSVAFNEVDDWLMKAKIIVDEEAGKLTPAEIMSIPKTNDIPGEVVSSVAMGDSPAVVVERDDTEVLFQPSPYEAVTTDSYSAPEAAYMPETYMADVPSDDYVSPVTDSVAPATEINPSEEKSAKSGKSKKKNKKAKDEAVNDEVTVPVKSSGKVGKIIGALCLVAGVALIIVAILILLNII